MPTNHGNEHPGEYDAGPGEIDRPNSGPESAQLGYETTDVNTGGIVVFIGGLFGFVLIFFVFCFFMGKAINSGLNKDDGPKDKWHQGPQIFGGAGNVMANGKTGKREDLKSNAAMAQQELQQMTTSFPNPRLDIDDGNQATADLHAREDLLLEHYSSVPGEPGIRIPIERAMELIAQRGLPVATAAKSTTETAGGAMFGDRESMVTAPLTSGFARTGYELDTIEARRQKMDYGKAEANAHAELRPVK